MRSSLIINGSYRRFISLLLLACVLCGALPVSAQTRRAASRMPSGGAGAATNRPASSPKACAGGWSGVVTFTKTLNDSLSTDEPGIRKNTDRIRHETSRNYKYEARAVVDGTDPKNPSVSTKVSFTDNDLQWGEEKVFDSCNSRESGHWFIISSNDDRVTQAATQGPARSFNLHVDELGGTYGFSLQLPDAKGIFKHEQHTKRSGHCQPKNNEPFDRSESDATIINGESTSIDGQKIDPDNPDVLSGSKSWDTSSANVKSFAYTVTWRFTRCPQKLLITEMKFEHPKFPNFDDWREIEEQAGTIDGNRVKIKAKVLNMSGETKYATLKLAETYKGDKWDGARADEPLPESETSLRLEGGEEREVEFVWDTEGQSWFDDGRPHLTHRIRAELDEDGQKRDEKTQNLKVAPKPLVLVHGLWSSWKAWETWQNILTFTHSYDWKAYPVGEHPEHGRLNTGGAFLSSEKTNSIYENADELGRYVRYAQENSNAWHVDIVAHSMGGLISRLYIHKLMADVPDNRPLVKHLVMLGTPNMGSPCADVMDMKFSAFGERVEAIKELKPEEVATFNKYVTNRKGVKFSALAGNPIPVMCGGYAWNDGVVSVESAIYGVEDHALSKDVHTELTSTRNFSNFVKPHLVTGPKGTYPLPVHSDPASLDKYKIEGASYEAPHASNDVSTYLSAAFVRAEGKAAEPFTGEVGSAEPFTKELKLAPKQTTEVELPVAAAQSFGLTFMADARVSATLVDDGGAVRGKSLAGSPGAAGFFRSIFVASAVRAGTWRLRLENTSADECVVLLATWDGAKTATPSASAAD